MGKKENFCASLFETLGSVGSDISRDVRYHEVIGSTSTELSRIVKQNPKSGVIVAAGSQTTGRGRMGRTWCSPAGDNLYISVAVDVGDPQSARLKLLPLAAGIAAFDAIEDIRPFGLRLKWPNDVLLNQKKVAGILCEIPSLITRPLIVIGGLGVNLGHNVFEGELKEKAATLCLTDDRQNSIGLEAGAVAGRWVAHLEQWMNRIEAGEGQSAVNEWKKRAEPFGRRVKIDNIEGTTKDLDAEGKLIIEKATGELVTIAGGIVEECFEIG